MSLDPNYPQLLMLKKVAKALDEMAKNEELMSGILAAAEDEDEERLNTIGEDDEDKQFDTHKGAAAKKKATEEYSQEDKDFDEDDYEF